MGVEARQYLYSKPGFVPVYIRPGNTPLEDINLDLAEAFHFYDQKNGRIYYGRLINDQLEVSKKKVTDKNPDIDIVSLEHEAVENNKISHSTDSIQSHHIQKIPRH